jgi:hypothetical protein
VQLWHREPSPGAVVARVSPDLCADVGGGALSPCADVTKSQCRCGQRVGTVPFPMCAKLARKLTGWAKSQRGHMAPDWAHPLPHLHRDWAHPLPHLHRDWVHHAGPLVLAGTWRSHSARRSAVARCRPCRGRRLRPPRTRPHLPRTCRLRRPRRGRASRRLRGRTLRPTVRGDPTLDFARDFVMACMVYRTVRCSNDWRGRVGGSAAGPNLVLQHVAACCNTSLALQHAATCCN